MSNCVQDGRGVVPGVGRSRHHAHGLQLHQGRPGRGQEARGQGHRQQVQDPQGLCHHRKLTISSIVASKAKVSD